MAKLSEIVTVNNDVVFGGAVQVDWFYKEKSDLIADNFVFHGPDFFGVTEGDVEYADHKLMDTCSYTKLISDKLSTEDGNPLILTIAGYGTGKSHLAVTLGKLFENRDEAIVNKIMNNIRNADTAIADDIRSNNDKKNLVFVLNGMKDFNLNIEILSVAKTVLSTYGYSDDFFSDITKAYTIAKIFIERNFELHKTLFNDEFNELNYSNDTLYNHILDNIFKDEIFNAINNIYEKINGTRIRWDEGITASEILRKLNERLCGENGDFNKILILFDEFGRYIEFAADRPELAGDSALQQIYETIQDSNNGIILIGFIQSDLKTYMARVKKSSNIARYIGRYESGEKLYLSSNLETIFANLISRCDSHLYKEYVVDSIESSNNSKKYSDLFKDINAWSSYASTKGVWKNKVKFNEILVKGIYPMNPFSVLLLTSLSDWYQQRSALNFFMDSVKKIGDCEVDKLGVLPQIHSTDIIRGDLFTELLLAEKDGRQRSEHCMMFDRIIVKHGDKFVGNQSIILSAVLVFKLLKLRVSSKAEVTRAFSYLSGINHKLIELDLEDLENKIGVIVYDENRNVYDFVEDATGQNDFNVHFNRVRNSLEYITIEALITGDIKNKLGLISDMQTDFSKIHNIKTNEWSFKQEIKTVHELDDNYFKSLCDLLDQNTQVNSTRGVFIYVYLSEKDNYNLVIELYKKYKIFNYPVILWLLDDSERLLYRFLLNEKIISSFSKEETVKYSRFIDNFLENNELDMTAAFKALQSRREIITENGIIKVNKRMKILLKDRFEELYPSIIPFPFEGFTNKQLGTPKKNLCLIAKSMLAGSIDYSWIQVQDKGMRNIVSNIFIYPAIGWGILSENYKMQYPTNKNLYKLLNSFDSELLETEKMSLYDMYTRCVAPPIGMNDYSFSLLLAVYLRFKGIEAKVLYNDKIIKNAEWSTLFYKDKSVDLKVLEDSYVIKVNVKGYLKKYQMLCNEIEHESNISRFNELFEKLEDLEQENDPPKELSEKVQACHMRLEVGINQLKDFRNKISSIKGEFNRGIDGKVEYKFLLNALVKGRELIEQENQTNGHFNIPVEELEELDRISDVGRTIVEEKYLSFIKKQKCMSVSGVGPYRKWLERLADNLTKLGYTRLATETLVHMESTTSSLENIRKVQEAVEKCETYLKVTKPNQYSTQEELLNYQKEGTILLELIKENKVIDVRTKENFVLMLNKVLEDITKRLEGITKMITELYDKAYEIESIEEVEELKSLIHHLLEKGIRHDEKEYIEIIGRVITSCLNDLNEIRSNVKLPHRIKRIEELKLKYDEYSDDVDLSDLLNNCIMQVKGEIEKENSYWMENYDLDVNQGIESWDAQKCQSYILKTDSLPDFLTEVNSIRITNNRLKVTERIKELRIDSIIELFKDLDVSEKHKCIKILNSHIE